MIEKLEPVLIEKISDTQSFYSVLTKEQEKINEIIDYLKRLDNIIYEHYGVNV